MTRSGMTSHQVTRLLQRVREGEQGALDELMPLVYGELRRIARSFMRRQQPGHTLQPTALVNEAFIKLFQDAEPHLADRAHFLALMSRFTVRSYFFRADVQLMTTVIGGAGAAEFGATGFSRTRWPSRDNE